MYLKPVIAAALFSLSPLVYSSNLFNLTNQPLSINNCKLTETNNPLDIALTNDGYFVVSSHKKNASLKFTRYGKLWLDQDYYVRTSSGEYLFGINKESDANKLKALKVTKGDLPPKATTKVKMFANFPALASKGEQVSLSYTILGPISDDHVLKIDFTNKGLSLWAAQVTVDGIKLNQGNISFGASGQLFEQQGLSYIQWPTDYGLYDLKLDFSKSTGYASPFEVDLMSGNGNRVSKLNGLMIDNNGDIYMRYDNGMAKKLKHQIAVAKFSNPSYLELVGERLYTPTDKSGAPRLHRENSKFAILEGSLEEQPCFTH